MVCLAFGFRVTKGESPVVEALEKQDDICKGIVDGKDDLVIVSGRLSYSKSGVHTIVGIIPCRTPPAILKKSPAVTKALAFKNQNMDHQ